MKVRIKFRKYGILKYIGHLDVMRFFQKVMRRADIPIAFSGGYSPHMIMSFANPLGIGLTSDGEYFDIEYREDKGDRTENDMTIFDSAIPDNYELLKVIPIIDLNLFKGKDITFGLVFRPTIKEIINEK